MKKQIFLFEFKHFVRDKAKLFSYIFFMLLCFLAIYNGYSLMNKQLDTISEINNKNESEINKINNWLETNKQGPDDKSWVNIEDPYWAIRYTPSYVIKIPSEIFPIAIGQSEHFGFYKKVTRWSSSFDSDMVEEISNYERLVNGNIDFSFITIFLLPILLIILVYNINGMEKDLNFHKLIIIQHNSIKNWILSRLLFYIFLLIVSIDILIFGVGFINGIENNIYSILKIILISNLYIISFSIIFYFVILYADSSSSSAFKMISIWLIFCVIIPGSVHQYASYKYPVNYMTDFLDVNRKQTYEVFKLENIDIYDILMQIHPELTETDKSNDQTDDNQLIRRSISTIINQMNINASHEIEMQNENKNEIIRSTYFFNPISYIQNLWNSVGSTDYYAYKNFRAKIESSVINRNNLIISELWNEKKVNKDVYQEYLKILN